MDPYETSCKLFGDGGGDSYRKENCGNPWSFIKTWPAMFLNLCGSSEARRKFQPPKKSFFFLVVGTRASHVGSVKVPEEETVKRNWGIGAIVGLSVWGDCANPGPISQQKKTARPRS
jgi:hypothetical protein